jgi:hypothetical protein
METDCGIGALASIVFLHKTTIAANEHSIVAPDEIKWVPAPGGFFMNPGMQHFVFADQETEVQVNTTGPWGITYVNTQDDPRKTQ